MRRPRKLEKAGTQSPLECRAWPAALENGQDTLAQALVCVPASWARRHGSRDHLVCPGPRASWRTRDKLVSLPRLWARPLALAASPHCPHLPPVFGQHTPHVSQEAPLVLSTRGCPHPPGLTRAPGPEHRRGPQHSFPHPSPRSTWRRPDCSLAPPVPRRHLHPRNSNLAEASP